MDLQSEATEMCQMGHIEKCNGDDSIKQQNTAIQSTAIMLFPPVIFSTVQKQCEMTWMANGTFCTFGEPNWIQFLPATSNEVHYMPGYLIETGTRREDYVVFSRFTKTS